MAAVSCAKEEITRFTPAAMAREKLGAAPSGNQAEYDPENLQGLANPGFQANSDDIGF